MRNARASTMTLALLLISGTLSVKFGGKNMTFYQRVTVRPLGDCASEANESHTGRSG